MSKAKQDWVGVEDILQATGMGRRTFYKWIELGIIPAAEHVARASGRGRPRSVWPRAVIAHLQECRRLSRQNVPFDRLPRWQEKGTIKA